MSTRHPPHLGPAHAGSHFNVPRGSAVSAQKQGAGLDDPMTLRLINRIAELELEQREARSRMEQLNRDKKRFEATLSQLRAETSAIQQIKTEQAALQARLVEAVEKKNAEQRALREQIDTSQQRAEEEINRLRAERDQALALTKTTQVQNVEHFNQHSWRMRALLIGVSVLSCVVIALLLLST